MADNRFSLKILLLVSFILVGILLAELSLAKPVQAGGSTQETEEYCLSCHGNPELNLTLPDGEILSLYISQEMLDASIHSPAGIECQACHTEITTYPHPEIQYQTARELARAYYLACRKCHKSNYDLAQDSMHARVAEAGNLSAPVCTDCHGDHDVRPPDQPRALISNTCGKCHSEINEVYKQSIHGGALINEENPDVPVCTDCHGVHNIQDPRTALFRVLSPDLCAGCHANPELMGKYGLSSDVYSLYETSWHGVDIAVYKASWPTIWHDSAVCTDCHGVHNIRPHTDVLSSVHPDNLQATCAKCHPGASPNWTGAWTGHNKISIDRTPILFYVDAFYSSFIDIVLWACIVYVLLQIIRATVDKVRRSLP